MKISDTHLKILKFATILLVAAVGFWQFHSVGYDWRQALEANNPWVFFLAMATLPALGFPISVCYIYAGISFEPTVAITACIAALTINLSSGYLITHSIFKKPIEAFLARKNWTVPKLSGQNQLRFAFLMRTVPGPPFFIQNLLLTLAGIPFWTYLWLSLATQGTIAVIVILFSRNLSQDPQSPTSIIIISMIILLFVAKGAQTLRKRFKTKQETNRTSTNKKT